MATINGAKRCSPYIDWSQKTRSHHPQSPSIFSSRCCLCAIKTLRSLGPEYLKCLPWVPSPAKCTLGAIEERAFFVVVSQLWHSLPREACLAQSLHTFRKYMKMELNRRGLLTSTFDLIFIVPILKLFYHPFFHSDFSCESLFLLFDVVLFMVYNLQEPP